MSKSKIVFPMNEFHQAYLKSVNEAAIQSVQEAVRKVAVSLNVPVHVKVAPNEALTALVVEMPDVLTPPDGPAPVVDDGPPPEAAA